MKTLPVVLILGLLVPAASLPGDRTLWVGKKDGSLQCEPNSGEKIADVRREAQERLKATLGVSRSLLGANLMVRKGMLIQTCGAPTGRWIILKIKAQAEPILKQLGFERVKLSSFTDVPR